MWLQIIEISLNASRVCAEVDTSGVHDFPSRLESFVSRCIIEGINDVHLYYRPDTNPYDITLLEQFAERKLLPLPLPRGGYSAYREHLQSADSGPELSFTFDTEAEIDEPDQDKESNPYLYRLTVSGLSGAAENINKAIAIIGTSMDLDSRSTLQLRLCVYELAMNTAEHGEFPIGSSSIDLTLEFEDTRVCVTYRDNSNPFPTISTADSELVRRNIIERKKRGLGLYMINRLSSDFFYERNDGWNISRFSLDISKEHVTVKKG